MLVPPDRWQTKQDFLPLNLADLDLRTLRRGSPLIPLFKVVRLVLRGRLDLADRILKHVDARTQAEVKKWIFFREGKTLAPVTEEEIMQEISVASILERQRMMLLQEGWRETEEEGKAGLAGNACHNRLLKNSAQRANLRLDRSLTEER